MAADPGWWSPIPFIGFVMAGLVALALTAFWIWMLVEVLVKETDSTTKIVWVIVVVFLGWLGALIYLLARRPVRISELGT